MATIHYSHCACLAHFGSTHVRRSAHSSPGRGTSTDTHWHRTKREPTPLSTSPSPHVPLGAASSTRRLRLRYPAGHMGSRASMRPARRLPSQQGPQSVASVVRMLPLLSWVASPSSWQPLGTLQHRRTQSQPRPSAVVDKPPRRTAAPGLLSRPNLVANAPKTTASDCRQPSFRPWKPAPLLQTPALQTERSRSFGRGPRARRSTVPRKKGEAQIMANVAHLALQAPGYSHPHTAPKGPNRAVKSSALTVLLSMPPTNNMVFVGSVDGSAPETADGRLAGATEPPPLRAPVASTTRSRLLPHISPCIASAAAASSFVEKRTKPYLRRPWNTT